MDAKIEGLADALKLAVEKLLEKEGMKTCFEERNKIVLVIDVNGVKSKVVIPMEPKKKVSRLEPELVARIKEIKKVLKGRRDSIYLFTLLMSLHSELSKVKITQLDKESRQAILPVLVAVQKDALMLLEADDEKADR